MRRVWLCLVLSACTGAGEGPAARAERPEAVILYRDTLSVILPGKRLCTGGRTMRGPNWSGELKGCPGRWAYRVNGAGRLGARVVLVEGAEGAASAELMPQEGVIWTYGAAP